MAQGLSVMGTTKLWVWAIGALLLTAGLELGVTPSTAMSEAGCDRERPSPSIAVSEGRYTRYYHLILKLQPQDFELTIAADLRPPRYATENRYDFSEYGQFEIFVRKEVFPVPAPRCERYIIVRMPGTDPLQADAARKLGEKRALFDALEELKRSGSGTCNVAIELNPYVRVVGTDPLQLELTGCNVFFRQAHGAYIDRVGPLNE